MPSLVFDPPSTIEGCGAAGRKLGLAWGTRSRVEFEEALSCHLVALSEALASSVLDADEAEATFDQAAWAAWEAMQVEAAEGVGVNRRRGLWLVKK